MRSYRLVAFLVGFLAALLVAFLVILLVVVAEGSDTYQCPAGTTEVARWEPCCSMVYGGKTVIVWDIEYVEKPFPMTIVGFVVQRGYVYYVYAQGTDPGVGFLQDWPFLALPGEDKKFGMPGITSLSDEISHIGWCTLNPRSFLPYI